MGISLNNWLWNKRNRNPDWFIGNLASWHARRRWLSILYCRGTGKDGVPTDQKTMAASTGSRHQALISL